MPLALASFGLLGAFGCGDRPPEPEADPEVPVEAGAELAAAAGTLALRQVVAIEMENPDPFSNEWGVAETVSLLVATWTREGEALTWEERLCSVEQNELFGTTTTFPEAFVASSPARTRRARLGETFELEPYVDVLGCELDDPEDALPSEPDDPRVTDADDDGNPGVTVHIENELLGSGDAYVAQRVRASAEGEQVGADRIEARLDATTEQVVLDASAWWLELSTEQRPAPDRSALVARTVPDGTDCAALIAAGETLFD